MAPTETMRGAAPVTAGTAGRPAGRTGLTVLGIVMMLGGVLAFANPFAASLAVTAVAGATFLVAGFVQLWMAFSQQNEAVGGRVLGALIGLGLVLFAVSLLMNPIAGLVTLTIAVAVLLAMLGSLRLAFAFRMRPRAGWGWIAGSGIISILLAVLIVLGLPAAAEDVLGLFLAVDLTVSGIAMLALGWRRPEPG